MFISLFPAERFEIQISNFPVSRFEIKIVHCTTAGFWTWHSQNFQLKDLRFQTSSHKISAFGQDKIKCFSQTMKKLGSKDSNLVHAKSSKNSGSKFGNLTHENLASFWE